MAESFHVGRHIVIKIMLNAVLSGLLMSNPEKRIILQKYYFAISTLSELYSALDIASQLGLKIILTLQDF